MSPVIVAHEQGWFLPTFSTVYRRMNKKIRATGEQGKELLYEPILEKLLSGIGKA